MPTHTEKPLLAIILKKIMLFLSARIDLHFNLGKRKREKKKREGEEKGSQMQRERKEEQTK